MPTEKYYTIVAEAGAQKGVIKMSGYIYPWQNNHEVFAADFKNLEQSYKEIDIQIINLFGGSVFEGIPTYNMIRGSKAKTNTITQGVAASMGSIIALAGNNSRLIAPMSRLMLHRAKGGAYGDFEDFMDQSKLLKDLHADLAGVYVANSNKELSWVYNNWMVRGSDKWLNVQECLDFGLMTGTTNSVIQSDAPEDVLAKGPEAVAEFYGVQMAADPSVKFNNTNNETMKKVLMVLGLNEAASEDAAVAAIQSQINAAKKEASDEKQGTINDLQAKLDAIEKSTKTAAATLLVDTAINAKKIAPAQKDAYMKLAEQDYDSTKAILDGLSGVTASIKEQLEKNKEVSPSAEKDFDWYQRNDPDALAEIRTKDRSRYDAMLADYNKKKP